MRLFQWIMKPGNEALGFLVIPAIALIIFASLWQYVLNFWLGYFEIGRHEAPWVMGLVLSVIPGFGQISPVLAVVTWALSVWVL